MALNCARPSVNDYLNLDVALTNRMNYLLNVYRITKRYQTEADKFNASDWRFIRWLIDTGCYNG